jgi:hypothetical protein
LHVGNSLPLIAGIIRKYQVAFPTLPWSCPIKKKKYFSNYTAIYKPTDKLDMHGALKEMAPNGVYRIIVNAFTKEDPIGLHAKWINEIHTKMGENDW